MSDKITLDYLKKQNNALYKILDHCFDGVAIVTSDLKHIYWNTGAEKITGYTKSQIIGKTCQEVPINHFDETGKWLCKFGCPALEGLKRTENIKKKMYFNHKNGNRVPIMAHISSIKSEKGEIIAIMEIFRDISSEENYRLLQEKYQELASRYISKATQEGILEKLHSQDSPIVKSRNLTVLYLDIVGFTTFSEKHPSEEVIEMLNKVFGICEVITQECQGDIDKFIGDAVMAVFLDANDAAEAARKILTSVIEQQKLISKDTQTPIKIRIGINSGKVLQAEIGTQNRKDLTVIGDAVNTASRIESACTPNSIFISATTFTHLNQENAKLFTYHGEIAVKGKQQAINIFKLR